MLSSLVSATMHSQIGGGALTIAILLLATTCLTSADRNHGQISSVRVVGSVFCDTCFRQEFSNNSYFIKGAPVAVECESEKEVPSFRIETKTNKHGQFKVELPASLFHSETQLKKCSAKLLQKEGPCRVPSMANVSSFTLKSKKGGIHTYSAGFFTYKPQIIPASCSNEVANPNSKSNEIEVSKKSEFESSKQVVLPPKKSEFESSKQVLRPSPPSIGNLPKPSQLDPLIPLIPLPPIPLVPILPVPLVPIPPIPLIPPVPLVPIPLLPPAQHTLKSHPAQP